MMSRRRTSAFVCTPRSVGLEVGLEACKSGDIGRKRSTLQQPYRNHGNHLAKFMNQRGGIEHLEDTGITRVNKKVTCKVQ